MAESGPTSSRERSGEALSAARGGASDDVSGPVPALAVEAGYDPVVLLAAVLRSAPTGVAIIDDALRCRDVNAALRAMTGDAPAPGGVIETVDTLLAAVAERDTVLAWLREALDTGTARLDEPVAWEVSGAPPRVLRAVVNCVPIAIDGGRGVAMIVVDESARHDAEQAERSRDEFLAVVSHELRTPLTAILGWSSILRARHDDPALVTRGLDIIERNARAQARLVDEVLDVSRIIAGRLRIATRATDVAAVVHAALDVVRPIAEARSVELVAEVERTARMRTLDGERVQQIAWNLLSNAVKFTPRGGRVGLALEHSDDSIRLVVSDTGRGIPRRFLPYLFERFRQADSSATRQHGGLGLGLAIVRHLVELHGGTIRADSGGEGLGATFTVEIPAPISLEESYVEEPVRLTRPGGSVPPPQGDLYGLTIFLVDDEPDALELISMILRGAGSRVVTAGSAEEALEKLADVTPDVIVSDIGMPDVDGYAFVLRARDLFVERDRWVPALALTAYATREDVRRALRAGFQSHLAKPLDATELVSAVARLVGR